MRLLKGQVGDPSTGPATKEDSSNSAKYITLNHATMRKLITTVLILFTAFCVKAQNNSDSSFRILWYKGKKLSSNCLVTRTGDTIRYNSATGIVKVIAQKGKESKYDKMMAENSRTDLQTKQFIQAIRTSIPKSVLPVYAETIKNTFLDVEEIYNHILTNTITLPEANLKTFASIHQQGASEQNASKTEGGAYDGILERGVSELENWMNAHKDEKITSVPAPPKRQFDYCHTYSKDADNIWDKEYQAFQKELRGQDYEIFQKVLGASRQVSLLGGSKADDLYNRLDKIIQFIMHRNYLRTMLLLEKFADDPDRCYATLLFCLSDDRQRQLYGNEQLPDGYIEHCLTTLLGVFKKALEEKNYGIALNLRLILGTERQCSLLIDQKVYGSLFDDLRKFNQFKLLFNVSAKISGQGTYQLASAKADNWFMAIPDTSCRLQWYLVGPNVNKLKIELTASEMRGNGQAMTYVGTKKWMSSIPTMKVDFCGGHQDSIEIYRFDPEGFRELWSLPTIGVQNLTLTNNVLLNCFLDVDRIKQDAAKFQNPAEVEKLKNEMMAEYSKMSKSNLMKTVENGSGYNTQKLGQWAQMQSASRKISSLMQQANPGRYLFTPTVHNEEEIIIDEKINGKELFPQNTATQYALFFLKLEHDPNGPYSFHL
jgi:hypothetical protein